MKKQLYEVFYQDSLTGKLAQKLIVSNDLEVSDYVHDLIKQGDINTDQEIPTVLGYAYIGGYRIAPISEDLEDIVKKLQKKSVHRYSSIKEGVAYLEALNDILNEANKDWKKEIPAPQGRVYTTLRGVLGGNNIPQGYSNEGERI